MPSFTTRVVLHDADWDDYTDVLHPAMAKQGFKRTITNSDGKTYDLPDAEYNLIGELTRQQVLDRAKAAAAMTKKKYSVLVTESNGRTWYNLDPATK